MTTPVRQSSPSGTRAPGRPAPRRRWTRARRSSAALAQIEARHLARSPLLWTGLALALPLLYLELGSFWPALAGDDWLAHFFVPVLGGGALLAGAWLALRDGASGAADLVAVTPTAPWRLQWTRLAAVAVVAAGAFAVVFAAALAFSAVRGGRGTPDLRLLADGMLAMVLSGWVGVAVGRLSGSRMVSVLAAPLWAAVCLVGPMVLADSDLPVQRLLPSLTTETRSAVLGFLPDALWPHLGYLAGVVLLLGVLLLALAARGSAQRPPLAPVLAAGLAGLLLVGVSGPRLVALPDREVVVGPGAADRRPLNIGHESDVDLDPSFVYPPDDRARSCAGDATLTVCVYPVYGEDLASFIRAGMDPVARLLAGLPGVPTRARMVPGDQWGGTCSGTEVLLSETDGRAAGQSGGASQKSHWAGSYLDCALDARRLDPSDWAAPHTRARRAVALWALLASGVVTGQELDHALRTEEAGGALALVHPWDVAPLALAMTRMPPGQVRAELAPVWDRLRAGILPVAELPGQRP